MYLSDIFVLKLIVKLIILGCLINKTFSITKSRWNDIKKETKNILEKNWKQPRGITQVGPKPGSYLDYPGFDQAKLEQNRILWDLYYKCLNDQSFHTNSKHVFAAKVIKTFKSFSLKLECELCISPKGLTNKNVWFYSILEKNRSLRLLKENDYYRISPIDLSLTIINIDESKSGFYQCIISSSESRPFIIELFNEDIEPFLEIQCHNDEVFEILDPQGNIIDKVNNSAGIYSSQQIIPELPPKTEKILIITHLNQNFNITCPGNLNTDAPYVWKLNNKTILPLISKSAEDHIYTDILHRLIIQNITKKDETIFTCWQLNYLAGIVRVKIIKEFKLSIQEDMYLLYGAIPIIGLFLWVGFKVFFDKDAAYY
ncbi:uncharacterized protein LOC126896293 isoform X2 [Daktulosphaira vitifoliae]|uniref:uncharacterized protein LOC126896293 isoform X2 n=1 Tax=Daktulosphaira vitifoliae TaxID=58002 RepID=UPI0021AA9CBA|nr:uncharacterized protein LOC126896293 isoform X2 [Daktulosphaira vitifoliae]